jgi:hypothetical protein
MEVATAFFWEARSTLRVCVWTVLPLDTVCHDIERTVKNRWSRGSKSNTNEKEGAEDTDKSQANAFAIVWRARPAHRSCTARVALVGRLKLVVVLCGPVRDALEPEASSLTGFMG